MTLLYHRHHLSEELVAGFFDISQPTVSRMINLIGKALAKVLSPLIQSLKISLKAPGSLVIDGTLISPGTGAHLVE